jgi:hypothetical protein
MKRGLSRPPSDDFVGFDTPECIDTFLASIASRSRVGTEASRIQEMARPICPAGPVVSRLELYSDKVAYFSEDAVPNSCGNLSPSRFEHHFRTARKRPLALNACPGRGDVFQVDDLTPQPAG